METELIESSARARLCLRLMDTLAKAMSEGLANAETADLRITANNFTKMLLTTMSMGGMLKGEASKIYRDKTLSSFDKFMNVGLLYLQDMVNERNFHSAFGSTLDEHLMVFYKELSNYFESTG